MYIYIYIYIYSHPTPPFCSLPPSPAHQYALVWASAAHRVCVYTSPGHRLWSLGHVRDTCVCVRGGRVLLKGRRPSLEDSKGERGRSTQHEGLRDQTFVLQLCIHTCAVAQKSLAGADPSA